MTKVIHFCEGELALNNFILPICKKHKAGYLIFAQNISSFINYDAYTVKLPKYVRLKPKNLLDFLCLLPSIIYVLFLLNLHQPKCIVAHMTLNSPIVLFCAFLLRIPNRIYFNHGFSFIGYSSSVRIFLLISEYLNFAFSTQVVCVSPTQLNIVRRLGFMPKTPMHSTMPGSCAGLDSTLCISLDLLEQKQFKILEGNAPINVVYLGRPVKRKGIYMVIETIKFIEEMCDFANNPKMPLFCFTLIGISKEDLIRFSFSSTSLTVSSVTCVPHADNVFDSLSSSHIMFLPSYHEGFGYAYLEAASQANSLIGFDIPGPDSILLDSHNGYALPTSSSAEDFARALLFLYYNRSILSTHMKNSREISFSFNRETVLSSIMSLFE